MLTNFIVYMRHGFGFSKSFRFAVGVTVAEAAVRIAYYVVVSFTLLSLLILATNSVANSSIQDDKAHAAYVRSLEVLLDKCTSPGENAIYIDDELVFCGIYRTGVYK